MNRDKILAYYSPEALCCLIIYCSMIFYVAAATVDDDQEQGEDADVDDHSIVESFLTYGCPAYCDCWLHSPGLNATPYEGLSISFHNKPAAESDTVLRQEIDVMLANYTQIKGLDIQSSALTQIPAGVCNLTSLKQLSLDSNRLVALPDNCFSRLGQLRKFSASYNRIAYLQVLLRPCISNILHTHANM